MKENNPNKIFDFCYKKNLNVPLDLLHSNLVEEYKKLDKTISEDYLLTLKGFRNLDPDEYWSKHTPKYVDFIVRLVSQISNLRVDNAKALLCIAAANERDLTSPVLAARSSSKLSENSLPAIIFHNYKSKSPGKLSQNAVAKIKRLNNVHVVESQIPAYLNSGTVKKILADITIKKIDFDNLPLLMTDADVVGLSKGLIENSLQSLENSTLDLAASCNYDFTDELKSEHSLFGFIQNVRTKMNQKAENLNGYIKNTIGAFTAINSRTLLAIGGLKPVLVSNKNVDTAFADMQLTRDLVALSGFNIFHKQSPIANLSQDSKSYVYLDGAREVSEFEQNNITQWSSSKETFFKISGTVRPELSSLKAIEDNNQNRVIYLNRYWDSLLSSYSVKSPRDINKVSKWLISILHEMNLNVKISAIDYAHPQPETSQVSNVIEKIINTETWGIQKIISL